MSVHQKRTFEVSKMYLCSYSYGCDFTRIQIILLFSTQNYLMFFSVYEVHINRPQISFFLNIFVFS